MSFALSWAPEAARDLARLPHDAQRRVIAKVRAAAGDPVRFFKRLSGERVWTLRIGDYRAIADVDLRARRVEILTVGHRRNVYD